MSFVGMAVGPAPTSSTAVVLPTLTALLATYLLMGKQGLRAFWRALVDLVVRVCHSASLSAGSGIRMQLCRNPGQRHGVLEPELAVERRCWRRRSSALYLAINAAFLQPYLGDAARYFRNSPANVAVRRAIRKEAVDTLERLHNCGLYDRIIVVAHSLGMRRRLRHAARRTSAGSAASCRPSAELGPEFAEIDAAAWQPDQPASKSDKRVLREKARQTIANIAAAAEQPAEEQQVQELAGHRFRNARKRPDPCPLLDVSGQAPGRSSEGFRPPRQRARISDLPAEAAR